MTMLSIAMIIWSIAHLFPAVAPARRAELIAKLGDNAYRGLFSLVILASLVLIVIGWRSAPPTHVYAPPLAGNKIVVLIMPLAFILMAAASVPSNIRRIIRHPQMTGVIVWSGAHLLANGDSRSIVLFGGLGLWAVLEIILINRRDGAWQKPAPSGLAKDAIVIVGGISVTALLAYFHVYLSGIPLIVAH